MAKASRSGTLHATDRANGGVVFGLNRSPSNTAVSRSYRYSGPYNPFTLAERIYASDGALLSLLKDAGFIIHPETL